jgi:RNA polymerase sigma-70 factor (ECF subfamily)
MNRKIQGDILIKHFPLIEEYFRARVTQIEDIEDLSQETAYQVIRSWNRFQHRASVSTWIYSICRNVFTAYLRRKNRASKGMQGVYLHGTGQLTEEERKIIELVIESMEPGYQTLYNLYYCRGCSVKEISQSIAKPEGTVKYELYLLRRKARRLLE